MVEKWVENGPKKRPKNRPEIDGLRPKTPLNEACFRKMAKNDCSKNGRKSCFFEAEKWSKKWPKNGSKMAQNRGRKMATQAQTTLKI